MKLNNPLASSFFSRPSTNWRVLLNSRCWAKLWLRSSPAKRLSSEFTALATLCNPLYSQAVTKCPPTIK